MSLFSTNLAVNRHKKQKKVLNTFFCDNILRLFDVLLDFTTSEMMSDYYL